MRKRREERAEFNFGGNDVSADRGFASTTQPKQQGVNALYQCLLIKRSLSRYCTNHGREPVERELKFIQSISSEHILILYLIKFGNYGTLVRSLTIWGWCTVFSFPPFLHSYILGGYRGPAGPIRVSKRT